MKNKWFHGVATRATFLVFTVFTNWRVHFRAPLPPGPFIVMSNHCSFMDPQLVNASVQRKIIFFAKMELFENSRIMSWMVSNYGSIPIKRTGFDHGAFRTAEDLLKSGIAIGVFPEGTRNHRGVLQRGKPGSALLAMQSGVPVLPVALIGTERIRKWHDFLRHPTIDVIVGEPFTLPKVEGMPAKSVIVAATNTVMRHIAALLPEERRGPYSDAARPANAAPAPTSPRD